MSIHNGKEKELRLGIILNYIAIGIGLIVSLLLNPIIIRNLGKSEYGLYETIGSFVNYLAVLDLGFGSVVIRYTAKYQSEGDLVRRDEFLYTARRIYQVLAGFVVVLGLIMYCFLDVIFGKSFSVEELQKAKMLFLFVLGTTALSIFGQVYSGALSGVEVFIIPRIIRIMKTVVGKGACIAIILLGADSVGYTAMLFAFEIFGFTANVIYAHKFINFKKCRIRFAEVRELLVFTVFLFIQAIASQLYWTIDKLVLGAMIGTTVVATYSVSMNLHNIVENISVSVKDVLLPKATRFAVREDGKQHIQHFMVKAGRLVLMVYGLLFSGFLVLGKEFLVLWLGPEYVEAYSIFIILGASTLLPSVLSIGETVCRAFNKHQFLSYAYLVAAFINVALTIVFVKWWGMCGAAIATGVGLVLVYTILRMVYYKKMFELKLIEYFCGTFSGIGVALIITTIIGYVSCYLWDSYSWGSLCVQALTMGCVYTVYMILWGFNAEEKTAFRAIIYGIKHR